MADYIRDFNMSKTSTNDIGMAVNELMLTAKNHRKTFERRWYDNNFFDDGYHFRFLSRSTNRIVDLSERQTVHAPYRSIPKASRQIRGVANLMLSGDPTPAIYPERVERKDYATDQEFELAVKAASEEAKKVGFWVKDEFIERQNMMVKLAFAVLLAAKHSVSFIQVWPDIKGEKIRTQVFDAFDIYLMGNNTEIEDSPFLIKGTPTLISNIMSNPNFDQEQLTKINPDYKYAGSEIKEAYMNARFGRGTNNDGSATVILKEAFLKEYLDDDNMARIKKQDNADEILEDRKKGDCIIRQVFSAGNIWLRDEYLDMDSYPFVDIRLEPGPIYGVPFIERFIPQNKSLDSVVSRIERYLHTMVSGTWIKRSGEQFKLTNIAGGQVVEYDATPPVQANIAPIPGFVFAFVDLLSSFIEEQGVTTTTLGKLPKGVKANAAIESLKESELANLVISNRMLKDSIKKIVRKMLEIADDYFVEPQNVQYLEKGQPKYFDVIGNSAFKKRKNMDIGNPEGVVPIKGDYRVDIQIEQGMGFTKVGQRETMMQVANFMRDLALQGFIPAESVTMIVEKLLETYQYGATSEFMDSVKNGATTGNLSQKQIDAIKVSVLEVFKDLIDKGVLPKDEQQRIDESTYAAAKALKDTGVAKPQEPPKPPSVSISYKDAPEDVKRQMEQHAGFEPSEGISPSGSEQLKKHEDMQQKEVQNAANSVRPEGT